MSNLEQFAQYVAAPHVENGKTPGRLRWLGRSELGADSRAVLEELGYDAGQIDALADTGIIAGPDR